MSTGPTFELALMSAAEPHIYFEDGDEYLAMCERNRRYQCCECNAFLPTSYAKRAWASAGYWDDYDGPVCPQGQGCSRPKVDVDVEDTLDSSSTKTTKET